MSRTQKFYLLIFRPGFGTEAVGPWFGLEVFRVQFRKDRGRGTLFLPLKLTTFQTRLLHSKSFFERFGETLLNNSNGGEYQLLTDKNVLGDLMEKKALARSGDTFWVAQIVCCSGILPK